MRPDNKLAYLILYIFILFCCLGNSCKDYKSPVIIQKKKIYDAKCKGNNLFVNYYTFTGQRNESNFTLYTDEGGIFWVYGDGEDSKEKNHKEYSDKNSDYLNVTYLSGGEKWIQFRIYCVATGKLILDTGVVEATTAECFEYNTWFFFLDGHAKKKEGDSCFPKGLNIEGLKDVMKSND